MEVQRALAARGYQPGPIDGQLGKQTVSAMQKFQADNGLPQGQPSVEAVKLLGVPLIPLAK
jgi:peptidoglycan hydrolase-like protein with peptidoglycan-binding domain